MKHNPQATANALAATGGILYVICAAWVLVSASGFMGVMSTWFHGVDVEALPTRGPEFGTLMVGLVTFVVAAWLTGYLFASMYNFFAAKK